MTDYRQFTRFNVVGASGSGKSTIAEEIASRRGIEFIDLDALFWKPNWTEPTDEEFFPIVEAALSGDGWSLAGNYTRVVPIKWKRVEVIVWLDLPYPVIFFQVMKRTMLRSWHKEVLWAGNQESFFKAFFSRDSIILWSLTTMRTVRKKYAAAMDNPRLAHIHWVRLRSRREVAAFLQDLSADG